MTTPDTHTPGAGDWRRIDPARAGALADARAQLHHCVQFVSGFGISYLPPAGDDSHTSMTWDAARAALVSAPHAGVRVGLRLADLTLLVLRENAADVALPAHGISRERLHDRLRAVLADAGLDASRYTLTKHFEIPTHPVAEGARFDLTDVSAFAELSASYANAARLLAPIGAARGGSAVACWPHHFDIATLIAVGEGRTTGAGLAPGDTYYDEPYFYVNAYPPPPRDALADAPSGGGHWHTSDWIGGVLPGSRLAGDADAQRTQCDEFLRSALDALARVLTTRMG